MDDFFLQRIVELYQRGDTAKLASLRRAAGETLGAETARNVFWVYAYLGNPPKDHPNTALWESARFLTGTLLAFDRDTLEGKANTQDMSLATTLRGLTGAKTDKEIEEHPLTRRFRILLDADLSWDGASGELPYRLRQIVRYALQKDARIAWDRLLRDVQDWNSPTRKVQKKWARDYFSPYLPADTVDTDEPTDADTDTETA